jgi:hypothetical protein
MIPKLKILTAGGTLCCALGIGYLMQQSVPIYRAPQSPKPMVVQQVVLEPHGVSDVDDYAIFDMQGITLTSARPNIPAPRRLSHVSLDYDHVGRALTSTNDLLPPTPFDPDVPQLGCAISTTTTAAPMASVALSVDAPCYGNQRVTVHHSGLIFTETTNPQGQLQVTIPALSENAVFVIDFGNGLGAVAMSRVEDLSAFDRVALQWDGPAGFQIHAREFGVGYGEAGHVWTGATTQGQGKSLKLGVSDTLAPKLVEIYTYPTESSDRSGTVALSIETEVTKDNCGRDFVAQSFEMRGGEPLRTRDLSLSMPNCTATGDFLVLNNLVEDLKIASK